MMASYLYHLVDLKASSIAPERALSRALGLAMDLICKLPV